MGRECVFGVGVEVGWGCEGSWLGARGWELSQWLALEPQELTSGSRLPSLHHDGPVPVSSLEPLPTPLS